MSWWTAPSGATVVAAYDPIQGSSLSDSYINRANPGTFNAAPGVAPTWAYGTGWTFNGSTQYLTTGVAADVNYSMIVRFSGCADTALQVVAGGPSGGSTRFEIFPRYTANRRAYAINNGILDKAGFVSAGVMAIVAASAVGIGYLNGVSDTSSGAWSGAPPGVGVQIGRRSGSTLWYAGNVQALAIYSGTLTLADVVAITAAMNALPVATAKGLPVIAHHWLEEMYQ